MSEDPTDFGAFLEKQVAADPELSSLVDAAEKELAAGYDAEDYDDFDEDFDEEPPCHTCGGDGWVDSLVEETGRYGWDPDEPARCPNCRGSGLLKDCSTF